MALSFPEAIESEHMDHPDFRVGGKIFATLPRDEAHGVVLLSPTEQAEVMAGEPEGFSPVPGGWGRKGSTRVHFEKVTKDGLSRALKMAWRKRRPARLAANENAL